MKYISYNEKTKVFTLRTKNSMYQMQVRAYDTLVHLYYGADIGDTEAVHRIICLDRGFSGNPYEAGEDRTFSLDVLPQRLLRLHCMTELRILRYICYMEYFIILT